jgi:hypothetical protein
MIIQYPIIRLKTVLAGHVEGLLILGQPLLFLQVKPSQIQMILGKTVTKILLLSLFFMCGCQEKSILIVPGTGFPGCEIGMSKNEIDQQIKNELGEKLLFDENEKLALIAEIDDPKYKVVGYSIGVGDSVKDIPHPKKRNKEDEDAMKRKFAFEYENAASYGDGVVFIYDDKEVVKSFYITPLLQ